jgi:hypothetical protein
LASTLDKSIYSDEKKLKEVFNMIDRVNIFLTIGWQWIYYTSGDQEVVSAE